MQPEDALVNLPMRHIDLVLLMLAGLAISFVFVRLGILLAQKIAFVSYPNPIVRSQINSVAYGGGVMLLAVTILAAVVTLPFSPMIFFLAPVMVGLAVGIIDDVIRLGPAVKILGQLVAVAIYLLIAEPPLWSLIPIVIFLLTCQNAWNLVDVMDGLLGSIAAIIFIGLAVISIIYGGVGESVIQLAVITAGAIGGFLIWNKFPAKVYLGDSGSLPLGLLYGIMVIELFKAGPLPGILAIFLGMIPFFEISFLILERMRKGIPVYRGSPDHFSLRMLCSGWTVPAIIRGVVLTNIILMLLCFAVSLMPAEWAWYALSLVGLSIFTAITIVFRYMRDLPAWGDDRDDQ